MNALLIIASAAALAAASVAPGLVRAQPAADPVAEATTLCGPPCQAAATGRTSLRAARLAHAVRNDPGLAVVINLGAIERVYRQQGREQELGAFYRDVINRSKDPLVRNFVNYRLARIELRAKDGKAALDALTRNLEENLRRL